MFQMPWNEKKRVTFEDIVINDLYFALILAILMTFNSIYLNSLEPKFGKSAWIIAWLFFFILYSIPLIFTSITAALIKLDKKTHDIIHFIIISISILIIEVYCIFDLESFDLGKIIDISIIDLTVIFVMSILLLKFKLTNNKHKLVFLFITVTTIISSYSYFVLNADKDLSLWNAPSHSIDQYVIAIKYSKGECFKTYDEVRLLKEKDFSNEMHTTYLSQKWRGAGFIRIYYRYPQKKDIKMIGDRIRNRFEEIVDTDTLSKDCKVAVIDNFGYTVLIN